MVNQKAAITFDQAAQDIASQLDTLNKSRSYVLNIRDMVQAGIMSSDESLVFLSRIQNNITVTASDVGKIDVSVAATPVGVDFPDTPDIKP